MSEKYNAEFYGKCPYKQGFIKFPKKCNGWIKERYG
jgi:hypothetical protein